MSAIYFKALTVVGVLWFPAVGRPEVWCLAGKRNEKDFHEAGKVKNNNHPSQGAAALSELSYREDDLQQAAVLVLSQS